MRRGLAPLLLAYRFLRLLATSGLSRRRPLGGALKTLHLRALRLGLTLYDGLALPLDLMLADLLKLNELLALKLRGSVARCSDCAGCGESDQK